MVFVDGTNLLTELAKFLGLEFRPDKPPTAILDLSATLVHLHHYYDVPAHRVYWFGSYTGSDEDRDAIEDALRKQRVEATLFKRRETREKGVDIGLTKEMLVHAFHRNCDRSVLVAGDEDYVGLVNEVKRYGQNVHGLFFNGPPLSPHLHRALDAFTDLGSLTNHHNAVEKVEACRRAFPPKPTAALQLCPTCKKPMKQAVPA